MGAAARAVAVVALPPLVLRIFDLEKRETVVQGEPGAKGRDAEIVDVEMLCILWKMIFFFLLAVPWCRRMLRIGCR